MNTSPSQWKRARYWFDTTVSRGPRVLLLWHFALTLGLLLAMAVFAWTFELYHPGGRGFFWTLWFNTVLTLDPGTAANVEGGAIPQLAAALVVALVGVLIVGSLIGLIHHAIEMRVEDLRKGRSDVLEHGHVVILGWSHHVFAIVEELLHRGDTRCIAILADMDRVAMEDHLKEHFGRVPLPRIACRTGSPIDRRCLRIVAPEHASAIIVLEPETAYGDAQVVKTLLALAADLKGRQTLPRIVAQLGHAHNVKVALAAAPKYPAQDSGGGVSVPRRALRIVLTSHVIARALAQAGRTQAVSKVLWELLEPGGNEIRLAQAPDAAGMSFADVVARAQGASVIGYSVGARAHINPRPDTKIPASASLIAIGGLGGEVELAASGPGIDGLATADIPRTGGSAERTLILGYSRKVRRIVRELHACSPPGSTITIVSQSGTLTAESIDPRIAIETCQGDPTDRHVLDALRVSQYDHVIIVAGEERDRQYADARTIMTLLHLREIADARGNGFTIACELRDRANTELARLAVDDGRVVIVDDRLISRMLTLVADDPVKGAVFSDLFNAEGSEIYVRRAVDYAPSDRPVTFASVIASASRRNEVAIGYQHDGREVVLNPAKEAAVTFREGDRLIVLAEE